MSSLVVLIESIDKWLFPKKGEPVKDKISVLDAFALMTIS